MWEHEMIKQDPVHRVGLDRSHGWLVLIRESIEVIRRVS